MEVPTAYEVACGKVENLEDKVEKTPAKYSKLRRVIGTGLMLLASGLSALVSKANAYDMAGKITNVWNDSALTCLDVRFGSKSTETDSSGNFTLKDVSGDGNLIVTDNLINFYNYKQSMNVAGNINQDIQMIPLITLDQASQFDNFLSKFKYMTSTDGTATTTELHVWNVVPIPIFLGDFTNEYEIDYDSLARDSIIPIAIEGKVGMKLFEETLVPNDTGYGATFRYDKINSYTVFDAWMPDTTPKHCKNYIKNDWDQKFRVIIDMQHELCWALRFVNMSPDTYDVSHGGWGMEGFSDDEAKIVRVMYKLKNKTDMDFYTDKTFGIEEKNKKEGLDKLAAKAYPNPFTAYTVIKLFSHQAIKGKIQVYDMVGRLVEERSEKREAIIGKNLPAGIYFVKVRGYKPTKIIKLSGK